MKQELQYTLLEVVLHHWRSCSVEISSVKFQLLLFLGIYVHQTKHIISSRNCFAQ